MCKKLQSLKLFQPSMFNAKMFRPLVDYSDHDEDVEEEEEDNNLNSVKEEKSEAGKGMEKFITVKHMKRHTHH